MLKVLAGILLSSVMVACGTTLNKGASGSNSAQLSMVLAAQDDKHKARYPFRNPQKTLEFFQVTPSMTVVEVLPGGGWYSKILLPYLGGEGTLIGADYSMAMWPNFDFVNDEFIQQRQGWPAKWVADSDTWGGESPASAVGATIDTIPGVYKGKADKVLFIRALHNLARFEDKGQFLSNAMKASFEVLKPGGHVGIVQHVMDESVPDAWVDGSRGYMKVSDIKKRMLEAGFEFVGSSPVNLNPLDKPAEGDIVWRLPPSLSGLEVGTEAYNKMVNIGESNRATLLFVKP